MLTSDFQPYSETDSLVSTASSEYFSSEIDTVGPNENGNSPSNSSATTKKKSGNSKSRQRGPKKVKYWTLPTMSSGTFNPSMLTARQQLQYLAQKSKLGEESDSLELSPLRLDRIKFEEMKSLSLKEQNEIGNSRPQMLSNISSPLSTISHPQNVQTSPSSRTHANYKPAQRTGNLKKEFNRTASKNQSKLEKTFPLSQAIEPLPCKIEDPSSSNHLAPSTSELLPKSSFFDSARTFLFKYNNHRSKHFENFLKDFSKRLGLSADDEIIQKKRKEIINKAFSWKINELLREFPETNVIEVNEIYSVPIWLSSNTQYTILLNLPPLSGPNNLPMIFCEPTIVDHPMIEMDGMVKLFDGMGTDGDLVSILRMIIQLDPKLNKNHNNDSSNSTSATYNINNTPYYSNTSKSSNQLNLSLIDSLTEDQVEKLLKDEENFRKFLKNFNHIQEEREKLIDELRGEALQKAKTNLNLKKEVDALASKLEETHEIYSETCQSFQNFSVLNSPALAALNPENILTEIQVNLMELNDFTNNSIKDALNSPENLDLALKECVKLRTEYHTKSILLQKYQE